ncbi:DUF2961 domain-containing protein [Paenibacillus sp. J5C_2022]|uniref:glycoside hydrolase family 172 protein n=1 Tax=Paenibacillus sp. J5C2022 TaxID=2977129 RepID=UPI0021CE2250|nr:glycoside hydrolase family 172 protein [Paenibacillus sp. J5C2022]MCU6710933.1 DUF2961 domain-containing protein [Paenibacillus sp. J5C2022]
MMNGLNQLYRVEKGIKSKRISSYDRTGGNNDYTEIEANAVKTIAEMEGAGIVKHIWMTMASDDPMLRRNAIIRMYWDGSEHPSVEAPIGDFFGQGWGEKYNYMTIPLSAAPAGGNALNCYFPMPFSKGAKITIENDSDIPLHRFYYYVDYEEHASIPENAGRFHAWWNRKVTAPVHDIENEWGTLGPEFLNPSDKDNYLFAEIEGEGKLVGIHYFVDNPGPMWYGEGDDMFLIDGEAWPGSLHGTGTEDFFNTAWCPKENYQHPYYGIARVNEHMGWMGRTHCYRYFMEDPIYFEKSLRASIEHGHANGLTLDIASVAYWYQLEVHKKFPEIAPREQRQNMPPIDIAQMHRWRHAWRESKGKGLLWGHEQ